MEENKELIRLRKKVKELGTANRFLIAYVIMSIIIMLYNSFYC